LLRATLQELERAVQPLQRGGEIGALLDVETIGLEQVVQQLEGVADVLRGRFDVACAKRTVAAVQGAAPLGPAPQVYDVPPIVGNVRQHGAARHGAAVDPAATVGEEATGRKHGLICHQRRAGATRRVPV
jgi:hypothetical protein